MLLITFDYLQPKSNTCTIKGNFYLQTDYKAYDSEPFYNLRLVFLLM